MHCLYFPEFDHTIFDEDEEVHEESEDDDAVDDQESLGGDEPFNLRVAGS